MDDQSIKLPDGFLEREHWSPSAGGESVVPLSDPSGFPYLAVFPSRERLSSALSGVEAAQIPGALAVGIAMEAGWGLLLDVAGPDHQVFTFGELRDVLDPPSREEITHGVAPLELAPGSDIEVGLPGEERAPLGLRAAICHTLARVPGVKRAWLLQVAAPPADTLMLAVEDDPQLDGQAVVNRIAWAASVSRPIHLAVAGPRGPFAVEQLEQLEPVFDAAMRAHGHVHGPDCDHDHAHDHDHDHDHAHAHAHAHDHGHGDGHGGNGQGGAS